MDDKFIHASSKVIDNLKFAELKLNKENYILEETKPKFFGYIISEKGLASMKQAGFTKPCGASYNKQTIN